MQRRLPVGVFAGRIGAGVDQHRRGAALVRRHPDEELEDGQPLAVDDPRIAAAPQQRPDRAGAAEIGPHGCVQRRVPPPVLAVGVRAAGQQRLDGALPVGAARGDVERRPPVPVRQVGIAAGLQQQADRGLRAADRDGPRRAVGGEVERGVAVLVPDIGLAAGLEQRLHRLRRADAGGAVHRRPPALARHVGARPLGQQGAHLARIARRLAGDLQQAALIRRLRRGRGGEEEGETGEGREAGRAMHGGAVSMIFEHTIQSSMNSPMHPSSPAP